MICSAASVIIDFTKRQEFIRTVHTQISAAPKRQNTKHLKTLVQGGANSHLVKKVPIPIPVVSDGLEGKLWQTE